ncbi:hypothetical protein [Streptomyces yerevanensis]|uniref:hypothetical protein n=1 Tax=Streptomyces yerevanensis TaxID=66378 RepID=UPI0012FF08C2|nr:hypothetical protein [Streptomyces yerevanensis]
MSASGNSLPEIPEGDSSAVADHTCRFDFQDGWVNPTLDGGKRAEAMGLASLAVERFNHLQLTVDGKDLFDDLVNRAVDLKKRGDRP